jgi:hypothetical protein
MFCSQCGTTVAVGAGGCPRCGTPVPAAAPGQASPAPAGQSAQAPAGQPTRARVAGAPFRLDLHRLAGADAITGISTLVLFISLFLPWYGVSVFGFSAQVDGLSGHGYLYLVLFMCLAIGAYLVVSAGYSELPVQVPLSHQQRLTIATGVNAALVLLAFLVKPGDSGWRFGAFAGILAALVALGPQVIPALQARRARA